MVFRCRVTATDASSAGVFDDFTLTVGNVNDAPAITSNGGGAPAAVSVAENSTAVTRVTATDADALDVLRFAVSGGADAACFTIDPVSGELRFAMAPDRELPADTNADNRYEVMVSVSDGALGAQQSLTIDVSNVDEAPSIVVNSLLLSKGSTTLVLAGTDADTTAGALAYSASGVVGGQFERIAAPGVAITAFSQAEVSAGAVRFVVDGSGANPTYVLRLNDGVSSVISSAPVVVSELPAPAPALATPPQAPPAEATAAPAAPVAAARPPAAPPAIAPVAVPQTPAPAGLEQALSVARADEFYVPVRAPSGAAANAVPTATQAIRDAGIAGIATLDLFALPLFEGTDNNTAPSPFKLDLASALRERLLGQELDQLRDAVQISQHAVKDLQSSSAMLASSLSVGYVLWLARGGVLMASLMSALPAWTLVDPLPVLGRVRRRDGNDEPTLGDDAADGALEKMFSKPRKAGASVTPQTEGPRPQAAPTGQDEGPSPRERTKEQPA